MLSNSFELDLAKAGFNRLVKSRLGPIQLIENIYFNTIFIYFLVMHSLALHNVQVNLFLRTKKKVKTDSLDVRQDGVKLVKFVNSSPDLKSMFCRIQTSALWSELATSNFPEPVPNPHIFFL